MQPRLSRETVWYSTGTGPSQSTELSNERVCHLTSRLRKVRLTGEGNLSYGSMQIFRIKRLQVFVIGIVINLDTKSCQSALAASLPYWSR